MTGVAFFLLCAVPAFAQIDEISAKIEKSSCVPCFSAARVALQQLSGVESAEADHGSGTVRVRVKERQGVSMKEVIERIKMAAAGSEIEKIELSAVGQVETRGNRDVLVIPHQNETFLIDAQERKNMVDNLAKNEQKSRVRGTLTVAGNEYRVKVSLLQRAD